MLTVTGRNFAENSQIQLYEFKQFYLKGSGISSESI